MTRPNLEALREEARKDHFGTLLPSDVRVIIAYALELEATLSAFRTALTIAKSEEEVDRRIAAMSPDDLALLDGHAETWRVALRDARGQRAEAEATLANEHGEGSPPSHGWGWYVENTEGAWLRIQDGRRADVTPSHNGDTGSRWWHWWVITGSLEAPNIRANGTERCARDAMRAADAEFAKGAK